jgi:hypothetical protein
MSSLRVVRTLSVFLQQGGRSSRTIQAAVRERGCADWLIGAIIVTLCVGMIVAWLMS